MIMETKSSQYITKQILIVDAINSNNSNKTKPNFLSFPSRKKKKHTERGEIGLGIENSLKEYLKTA